MRNSWLLVCLVGGACGSSSAPPELVGLVGSDGATGSSSATTGGQRAVAPPEVAWVRGWSADLIEPARLALDAHGNLLISDPRRRELLVRDPHGRLVERVSLAAVPLGLVVDGEGRRVVGLAESGVIRFELDGRATQLASPGEPIRRPDDLAVHPNTGHLYVADGPGDQVVVLGGDGQVLEIIGSSELRQPAGIAVTDDQVWVTSRTAPHVLAFGLDGRLEKAFGAHGERNGELYLPRGLWVDQWDRVWVADARAGRVSVFDAGGTWLRHVGEHGVRPGQLRLPSDVVIDPWNRLMVAAANLGQVAIFGVGRFEDVDTHVPALVSVQPSSWSSLDPPHSLAVTVRVPGLGLRTLQALSVNGRPLQLGPDHDIDRDGVLERVGFVELAGLQAENGLLLQGHAAALQIEEPVPVEIRDVAEARLANPEDSGTWPQAGAP